MKRGPIICIFVVIFMLLACAAAYCFYDTSEESDLGDVNVPTIVKPNVQSQDKPIIDVYWDATCSMGGYAAIENDNLYKIMPDNLEAVASSMGQVNFFRFGENITQLSGREHRNFSNSSYYTELVTSIHNVISNANTEHVSIVVTDLYEDAADLGNVSRMMREKFFANHEAVAIIGIKNPFDGIVYDVGLNAQKFPYNSGNDPAKYRPFYLLIMGPENQVSTFLKKWQDRNIEGFDTQYVILTENLMGKSADLSNMKIVSDETENLLNNDVLSIQDKRIKQYEVDSMDSEAVLMTEFVYNPGLGSCDLDMDNLQADVKLYYLDNGEWLPLDTEKNVTMEWKQKENNTYQVAIRFVPSDVLKKEKINFVHIDLVPGDNGLKLPEWIRNWSLGNINVSAENFDGTKTVNFNGFVESLKDEVMNSQPVLVNMDMIINAKEGW